MFCQSINHLLNFFSVISVIAPATHKEEEISEKFHLDRVDNKSEIGVSITK
jgi:hypothetical protein